MAAVSVERAKGAPLHISFCMPLAMARPRFPDIFIPYFQNTETLAVYSIPTFEEFTKMFPGFPRSMPNLQSLTLETDTIEGWDPSIDLFESLTRTLSDLSLTNVPLTPSLLELRTLASLSLDYDQFNLPLDTLLNFLEENRDSLEFVGLAIKSTESSLRSSQRQIAVGNQFNYLLINSKNVMDVQTIISSISLRRGVHLEIFTCGAGLNDILSNISTTHLPNLLSPTFLKYRSCGQDIWLNGPNGAFSFRTLFNLGRPFTGFIEFPLLPLTNIRHFHLVHHRPYKRMATLDPVVFHPSSFPALETLTIECDFGVSHVLSPLLSNPPSSPSLNTITFHNCDLSEGFMEELRQFASDRKSTTASAWLHHVLIVHSGGDFPSADSIHKLRSCVRRVDVQMADRPLVGRM